MTVDQSTTRPRVRTAEQVNEERNRLAAELSGDARTLVAEVYEAEKKVRFESNRNLAGIFAASALKLAAKD